MWQRDHCSVIESLLVKKIFVIHFVDCRVDKTLHFRRLFVLDAYRGQGCSEMLIDAMSNAAYQKGFRVVTAMLTNIYSQRPFYKMGFKTKSIHKYEGNLEMFHRMDEELRKLHTEVHYAIKILSDTTTTAETAKARNI